MAEEEFKMSFEDALKELRLKEEELKRLVSEGQIRAIRVGETMKLRKSDVQKLRDQQWGEVVDLGGANEDLVFEDDTDLDAGMATEEIAQADTILEEDVEDVGVAQTTTTARTARRPAAARAAEEPEVEGMGLRVALIATSLVMVIAFPIVLSVGSGHLSDIAKGIASIFATFN